MTLGIDDGVGLPALDAESVHDHRIRSPIRDRPVLHGGVFLPVTMNPTGELLVDLGRPIELAMHHPTADILKSVEPTT